MKVLVTGADGFIGSHLVESLVADGHEVRALAYYNSHNSWGWLDHNPVSRDIEVVLGDIRDELCVREALKGCDLVYHLAALIGIPYSYVAPQSYVDTNVKGTLNIVQAARENGNVRVVHTSTSEVYGTALFVPITEEHPLQGQSPYSASKIGADQMALSYHQSFGVPVSIARPFNTYGPRQSNRAIIPTVIAQIANGATEIELGSLDPTRDFNFVADTVAGFKAIAASEASIGEVINLGSNFEVSIGDTAGLIAKLMAADVKFVTDPQRIRPKNSEVQRLWASADKAAELTGWAPQYAGLEGLSKGLQETILWFSDPHNLKFYKSDRYVV